MKSPHYKITLQFENDFRLITVLCSYTVCVYGRCWCSASHFGRDESNSHLLCVAIMWRDWKCNLANKSQLESHGTSQLKLTG